MRCMKTFPRISETRAERSLKPILKICRLELLPVFCWNASLSIKSTHEKESRTETETIQVLVALYKSRSSFAETKHYLRTFSHPQPHTAFTLGQWAHRFWYLLNTLFQRTTTKQQDLLQDGWLLQWKTIHRFSYHFIYGEDWLLSLSSETKAQVSSSQKDQIQELDLTNVMMITK